MATTLEEIKSFLDEKNIKYRHTDGKNYILIGFKTDNYKDLDGDQLINIVIVLEEDGEYIKLLVPRVYKCDKNLNSFHKLALFQTLLDVSCRTKLLQFEYDVDDGDITAVIEFPLEDASLTKKQLYRCISGITNLVEEYNEIILDAINHGITPEGRDEQRKAFEDFQRRRREERRQHLSED
jgi:hypothetical protein